MSQPTCWEPWTCPTCGKEWMFQWWNIEVDPGSKPLRPVDIRCDGCNTVGTVHVPVAAHGQVEDVAKWRDGMAELEAQLWGIPDFPPENGH